jgi:putative ABC transport system permease protein
VPPEQVATGGAVYLQLTGRLQDNVALESAAAEILTLSNAYNAEFPARMDANNNHFLRPFADELVGDMRPMFHVLIAACAFVLLIACANIASLFLGRLSARHKEIAVRLSLGATRRDIMRQFLMESLMFSLIAGVLGLLASMWAIDLVSTFASNQLPRADEIAFSGSVAAFSLIAAALTAVLVGLFPAWQASRANLTEVLKDTARSDGGGRAGRRLRAGLIIAEVTLSATLLIGASLLLTSFWKLLNADPGFDAQGTAIAFVNLPPNRYDTPEKRVAFHQQIEAELTRQPHITAASPIIGMPLSGFTPVMPYALKGEPIPSISERPLVGFRAAGVGYKDLLKLRLVEGRWFAETDTVDTPNVCVINESFARRIAPGESAVGRIVLSGRDGETENHVIGVIADLRTNGVNQPAPEELYYCAGQRAYPGMGIAARTTGDPALLQAAFRNALTQADPTIALSFFRTMDEAMRNALGVQRVSAWLVGCFAAISFLLAIVGLYSILAYNVTQRTMEIGIRMALGALPRDVIHAVLRQGLGLVAIGVVGGLLLAAGLSRLITAQLYGVPALSPTIYLGVATIYGLVATLACLLPARRASRVDPMVALRDE